MRASRFIRILEDFISLFYPHLCAACGSDLRKGMHVLCAGCLFRLPRTDFHRQADNPVERLFKGKVTIHAATALFHFSKGEKVQRLAHALKYKGRQDIGLFAGELIGEEILSSTRFGIIDAVIPVPLHPDRLRKRGYNQAAAISEGVSLRTGAIHWPDGLVRTRATETQTRKHRFERFRNVDRIFTVSEKHDLSGMHVLLVDDVLTTGATLVACAESLLQVKGVRVSIAAMATA